MSQQENYLSNLAQSFFMKPRIAPAKRFDAISFKIILGLQSELREIERRGFQDMPGDAASASLGGASSSQPMMSSTCQVGDSGEQLATFDDVRKKMETYQEFLLRFIQLYSLKPMDYIDHRALRYHLSGFDESKIDLKTWTNSDDLVGVCTTHLPKRDRLTELITKFLSWIISRRLLGKLFKGDNGNFIANEEKIAGYIVILNILIASILNVSALFILYAIDSTLARIGTICAFSLLFTLSSLLFTAADPIMVYTSTAAYSAVLVVFIGNVN